MNHTSLQIWFLICLCSYKFSICYKVDYTLQVDLDQQGQHLEPQWGQSQVLSKSSKSTQYHDNYNKNFLSQIFRYEDKIIHKVHQSKISVLKSSSIKLYHIQMLKAHYTNQTGDKLIH